MTWGRGAKPRKRPWERGCVSLLQGYPGIGYWLLLYLTLLSEPQIKKVEKKMEWKLFSIGLVVIAYYKNTRVRARC